MTALAISDRDALSISGRRHLGVWCEEAYGARFWSIQHDILGALSETRAVVTAPSCFSSGKTFLAGHVVWAFLDSYRPGVRGCRWCLREHGSDVCLGSKVVMTSSTKDHLLNVPWVEVRKARLKLERNGLRDLPMLYPRAAQTHEVPGYPDWFAIGLNPDNSDAISGFHAPHVLVIGEEATAIPNETAEGLNSLLASGDARLLGIYNPKLDDCWIEDVGRDPRTTVVRIRAYDTPYFTGEAVPPGATLITPDYLQDLVARGQGPGTYMWSTKVLARAWQETESILIPASWWDRACGKQHRRTGTRAMGLDLAAASNENVIVVRHGPQVVHLEAHKGSDQRLFWRGPVLDAIREHRPQVCIYDADGIGSGVGESVERLVRTLRRERIECEIIGFRGGSTAGRDFLNQRTHHWWRLRERFERGYIGIELSKPLADSIREQICKIRYGQTDRGALKVESKEAMRRRDMPSPDRADALMYAFAYDSDEPVRPAQIERAKDMSDEAFWADQAKRLDEEDVEYNTRSARVRRRFIDPVTGESAYDQ